MIDESNLLKYCFTGIYDNTKAMTQTELLMKIVEKINLVILNFNDLENKTLNNMKSLEKEVNYYLDTGMKQEVEKKLNEMVEDGTLNNIINNEIFYDLNEQVTINNQDIAGLKQTNLPNGN